MFTAVKVEGKSRNKEGRDSQDSPNRLARRGGGEAAYQIGGGAGQERQRQERESLDQGSFEKEFGFHPLARRKGEAQPVFRRDKPLFLPAFLVHATEAGGGGVMQDGYRLPGNGQDPAGLLHGASSGSSPLFSLAAASGPPPTGGMGMAGTL